VTKIATPPASSRNATKMIRPFMYGPFPCLRDSRGNKAMDGIKSSETIQGNRSNQARLARPRRPGSWFVVGKARIHLGEAGKAKEPKPRESRAKIDRGGKSAELRDFSSAAGGRNPPTRRWRPRHYKQRRGNGTPAEPLARLPCETISALSTKPAVFAGPAKRPVVSLSNRDLAVLRGSAQLTLFRPLPRRGTYDANYSAGAAFA
jgi:hypothetical protein